VKTETKSRKNNAGREVYILNKKHKIHDVPKMQKAYREE